MVDIAAYLLLLFLIIFAFKNPQGAFKCLLIILPIYGLLLSVLWNQLGISADAIRTLRGMKDAIIVGLFFVCVSNWNKIKATLLLKSKLGFYILFYFILILFFYFYGNEMLFATEATASSPDKITTLRFYLLPFVIFYFGMLNAGDIKFLKSIVKLLMVLGLICGIVSIIELAILPSDFLAQIGYTDYGYEFSNLREYQVSPNGLPFTYYAFNEMRRAASFFSAGPLDMASAMLLILPLSLGSLVYRIMSFRFSIIVAFCSLVSIILSISRVSIVMAICQCIIAVWFGQKSRVSIKSFKRLFILFLICIIVFIISNEKVLNFLLESFILDDPSSTGHLLSWGFALNIIISNPFGSGLGNGISESFFLNLWIEAGIFSLICVLTIIYLIIKKSYKNAYYAENTLVKFFGFVTFCSWLALSVEISKSSIGWAPTLAVLSTFFFAGVTIYYSLYKNKYINSLQP